MWRQQSHIKLPKAFLYKSQLILQMVARPKTTTQKERSKLPGSATGNLFYICGFIWHWGRQTSVHMRSCHTKIHISQMYSSYMLHLVTQQVHICCTAWFIGVICHIVSLGQKVCHFLGHNKVRVGWLGRCPGILWEPIWKCAHMQLVMENIRPQSSQLVEPLWTDPGIKEWN